MHGRGTEAVNTYDLLRSCQATYVACHSCSWKISSYSGVPTASDRDPEVKFIVRYMNEHELTKAPIGGINVSTISEDRIDLNTSSRVLP